MPTVAKLIEEGYTGYLVRATNDDMGDAPGLGTPGTIGENVLGNERDNDEVARVLGCKGNFDLNYNNHRMADVSLNELICRLIFLIRLLKVDTVVCWDPWAHDEENPDHYMLARGVEAACWMAGRAHDYPEQFAAGLKPTRCRTSITSPGGRRSRAWWTSAGRSIRRWTPTAPTGQGSGRAPRLAAAGRAGQKGQRLPLLGDDDVTADRNYIKEFGLARDRELGRQYGVEYAEAFHYIGGGGASGRIDTYVKEHATPGK